MQEMDGSHHILQGARLLDTFFNPDTNILTSWEVNPQNQTHRRSEQHLLSGMRRIKTETKHPHIGISDITTIVESKADESVKRVMLEQHGESKRITSSISFLDIDSFFARSSYGDGEKLYSSTVIILDKNILVKKITYTQRDKTESVEVVDKFGELLADREIQSIMPLELSLPGIDITVVKRPENINVGLRYNDKLTVIAFRSGIDFQKTYDTILSAEYEKWTNVISLVAPNISTAL
ncbi:MAG TPA: hypothetical protein PKA38_03410 [Candidatus Levybacteria bacterium]|nr:hypothetical protein [Candidatus Levybacteria bacterium]